MTNTKGEILALLKRNGGHTVTKLAEALSLASVTVRQHLTHLQRDGLIAVEREASTNGNGRPHYLYRLTAKAHAAAFPRRSDRLVELLVREVGTLGGDEVDGRTEHQKRTLVLRRLAARLAEEYKPLLQGWSLQERVSFVTEVMHADGGFAEWESTPKGFEIRDFNCLFHRLLNDTGTHGCDWHHCFLGETLGASVRVTPCADADEKCCRFLIEAI